MRKALVLLAMCLLLFLPKAEAAPRGTLLFVPLDNRPVCFEYAVQTMTAAGWEVLTPPEALIASNEHSGQPEALFEWLHKQAPQAYGVVLSTDALLYGGLVDSRTHQIDFAVLQERAQKLLKLKQQHNLLQVYAFATIMRSPKAASAPTEPAYFGEWGGKLFTLGALEDKLDLKQITSKEKKLLAIYREEIPIEIVADLMNRRGKNIRATELLLQGVESGSFDYLLIGRDDTAPFSQAHKEARHISNLVNKLPKEKIRFFSGADQLGLLLLSRAQTKLAYEVPLVYTYFAQGKGGATIPSYEDEPIAFSSLQHIYAAGAWRTKSPERADLLLAVNTPQDGITHEASSAYNNAPLAPAQKEFLDRTEAYLNEGKAVTVADVAFGNGADKALIEGMLAKKMPWRLASYGGWNTAGNALGFALAQGLLAKNISRADKNMLLMVRYLDDWAYQSNVRGAVAAELVWPNHWPSSNFNAEQLARAEALITEKMQALAVPKFGAAELAGYKYNLPWRRMFEIRVANEK